ncbi:hypothetical protein PROFUN_15868 [Planoprotostelium fungivorum]|uniref:Uncharacterized protein n=1 Tax=Planoprotostelium fungivorum TaxID=1890364 RepID=A0A2P6MSM6_9EUKA|nr:hypothetical protein PROFUN_16155 [Planoprotostelium fungivorum]PRP75233.1 hypothetical protein PROFUN_15868 [Planoprotostelium fungivorum]
MGAYIEPTPEPSAIRLKTLMDRLHRLWHTPQAGLQSSHKRNLVETWFTWDTLHPTLQWQSATLIEWIQRLDDCHKDHIAAVVAGTQLSTSLC